MGLIGWVVFGWPGQIALLVFAAWFLRGLWKALMRPRLRYVGHTKLKSGEKLLTVRRQERMPPWRELEETWLINGHRCTREGDGRAVSKGAYGDREGLAMDLCGVFEVALARDAEIEELTKEENNVRRP